MTRRVLPLLLAMAWTLPALAAPPTPLPDDTAFASIAQLKERFARGELTPQQLTELFLARIATLDQAGPRVNAVIEQNPDALAIARAAKPGKG